jgi:hypothetical protein
MLSLPPLIFRPLGGTQIRFASNKPKIYMISPLNSNEITPHIRHVDLSSYHSVDYDIFGFGHSFFPQGAGSRFSRVLPNVFKTMVLSGPLSTPRIGWVQSPNLYGIPRDISIS